MASDGTKIVTNGVQNLLLLKYLLFYLESDFISFTTSKHNYNDDEGGSKAVLLNPRY
jgi:hypothetical protein